ncbi:uncharacterized mitochondrial protein AtMg00810-like [Rutidosis leptorrhynchoides]|uniref:uncharacterized mitochondrial protein AtMg00810-like n=1 Tax=Rutidosis leptorrhynchoides TaxID=125765 RepID=UPI003A9A2E68
MDVYNAFLQGDLEEEIFMTILEGLGNLGGDNMVCKLHKSLYGLKHATRQGNHKDNKCSHTSWILIEHFKLKDLGVMKYFLGMEVSRSDDGIVINQRKYALELINDMSLSGARPVSTPFEHNLKLITKEYDDSVAKQSEGVDTVKDPLMKNPTKYKRLQPKESHYQAAIRIVRYIKSNPREGLFMPRNNELEVKAYCDSDWASCIINRRSVTGYCVKLGRFHGDHENRRRCLAHLLSQSTGQ